MYITKNTGIPRKQRISYRMAGAIGHLLFTVCCLLLTGCHYFTNYATDEKLAEVNGKVLFKSGVGMIFPSGLPAEDSLQMLQTYVSNWARKQLVAQMAEQYLNKEQKNVSMELEDYRMSLLIYRYEKMYMEQRLDTIVSEQEVKAFYNASAHNFILDKPVAQVIFIKVSEDIPQIKQIAKIYRSSIPEDRELLEHICSTVAEKYTNFNEQWVDAGMLANELPLTAGQIENEWKNGYIQANAGGYTYFVHLYRTAAVGEQAPVSYEQENISNIIRNKRKQELLKNLENSIYNDALNRNKLKLYINN
ncbi:MAG: hypothetical protein LBF81_01080 [Prevotellaceae bacterium]|jgi:metal-responsive CopG/Arc/MetJ family transcriptional regulator|nr:hypothetical protein [Prevotellaceae bacterium]